ncbi:MAG TPA: hypothetical protein DCZ94_15675 [Lentisphaeria bacterium]|nr:MAG: hypothetical protein A2X48_16940 [Lentisphaerae bacterium GWF2_49_21]HBC88388.1 hypothetical protein [Lentisphaeria bacterium]
MTIKTSSIKFNRLISCLLLFFCSLASSALFSGEDEPQKKLTLLLWNIPSKGSNDVNTKADREVFDLFIKKHPHINVKTLVPLKIQGPASEGNQFMAVAGGMAPDVFDLYGRKVGDYIDQGFLAPLNDRFMNDFSGKGKNYSGVEAPDKIWEISARDGLIYAVPRSYYFLALMYRKDLFIKAGLDPSRGPNDWDEMWEMGKRLTFIPAKEPGSPQDQMPVYGFSLVRGLHQGWHFLQFVWSGGGEVVKSFKDCPSCGKTVPVEIPCFDYSKFGIKLVNEAQYADKFARKNDACPECGKSLSGVSEIKWKLVTNGEGGIAALEFYRKIASQPWLRCLSDHPRREFDITPEMKRSGTAECPECGEKYDLASDGVSNRIYEGIARSTMGAVRGERYDYAMQITQLGGVINIDLTKWDLTAFPSKKGCAPKSFIAGGYLGINRTSPPERQEAAWQYIKFMTSEDAIQMRVKAMVENGMAQYVRPLLLEKYGYIDYYRELPSAWIELNKKVSETAEVEPYCKGFTHVMTVSLGHPIDMAILYPESSAREHMEKICREVNSTILGKRPKEVMDRYKIYAYWGILAVAVLIGLAFGYIIRMKMKSQAVAPDLYIPGLTRKRRAMYAWTFLSVAVLSIAVWQYYPLLRGSLMAFQDFKILEGGKFIGPQNFIEVVLENNFWQFIYQTFFYVFLSIAMGFVIPIALAVLLTEIPTGQVFFRTIYYLPAVTTGLVTMFLWKQLMFDPSPDGALNWLFSLVGIPQQTFLESPSIAMMCIIIPGIWAHAGPGCLIYLAAMKCIPEDEYEAADIDGAGFFHKFRHILYPNLKALILINFLGAFVGAFHASENIFVMTGGGPVNKTMTVGLDIWYHSFLYLNFGFATAEAWILGAMLIGFTVIQLQILGKVEFKRAGRAGEN